jgi:hypothetical protein
MALAALFDAGPGGSYRTIVMLPRLAAGVVLAGAFALTPPCGEGVAWAEAPPPVPAAAPAATPAATPAVAPAAAPAAAAHGAIVVAVADDAGAPARSLAREVYRDPALRPAIDDTTARVLAGEAPGEGPNKAKLAEMAELRASVAQAGADVASRKLLASLGVETRAELVIAVTMVGDRPVARALRVSSATYERIELGATIETTADGAKSFQWPGASTTLKGLLAPLPAPKPSTLGPRTKAPLPLPPPQKDTKESKPFWKSPWFWGSLGVVAAAGVTVFVLSRTTSAPGKVHLDGRVTP